MRTFNSTNKENGVVLLLILGFMAMFAVMVLTFIMITTNMSESADSGDLAGNSYGTNPATTVTAAEEVQTALKTVMVGSQNANSPIGPFSIAENIYSEPDLLAADQDYLTFTVENGARFFIGNGSSISLVIPGLSADRIQQILSQSGNVLTFMPFDEADYDFGNYWEKYIANTSVTVTKKYVETTEEGQNLFITILPSDRLLEMVEQNILTDATNAQIPFRLNTPAFSGTGAGGFSPESALDQAADNSGEEPESTSNTFALPFSLWANAAAPEGNDDRENSLSTFQRRLKNREFLPGDAYDADAVTQPAKMSASYTAADNRSLFLARLLSDDAGNLIVNSIIPSFHRPDKLNDLNNQIQKDLGSVSSTEPMDAVSQSVYQSALRKMTPRPLKMDHRHFEGGEIDKVADPSDVSSYLPRLINNSQNKPYEWDVDNDGDGIKEGIWIPSGLPIRTTSDGTPYATFYSFTIVDMDGRININTAGNWDQIYLDSLDEQNAFVQSVNAAGWRNDQNEMFDPPETDGMIKNGSGFGPGEINLFYALERAQIANPAQIASNMIWNRYRLLNAEHQVNAAELFAAGSMKNQPGKYTESSPQTVDDSDNHRLYWNFTDPIYDGDLASNDAADPNRFTFPWRGKTTLFSGDYSNPAQYYPTFDFNGRGMRVYDMLGNDLYIYARQGGENPYLMNPLSRSLADTPYQVTQLETLLRQQDYDAKSLPPEIAEDVTNHASEDEEYKTFFSNPRLYQAARRYLTTLSVDVPVPAQVFPIGPETAGDGVYSIRELVRRCVIMAFYEKNADSFDGGDFRENIYTLYGPGLVERRVNSEESEETEESEESETSIGIFREKIDQLTDEIFALLPEDTQAGRRLDLNELSHKASWLDRVYNAEGGTNSGDPAAHRRGIIERMKFARGLYVLLSVLTWQDRHAKTVAKFYGKDSDSIKNYTEGALQNDNAEKEQELFANRLAQWCVNFVDFTDPDATMTPFFYDPDPFDGWWSIGDDWMKTPDNKSAPVQRLDRAFIRNPNNNPDYANNAEFADFYPILYYILENPDNNTYSSVQYYDIDDKSDKPLLYRKFRDDLDFAVQLRLFNEEEVSYTQYIANWLEGKENHNSQSNTADFGFRRVWGMERPDLLLTETLSFHDLGIANTKAEKATEGMKTTDQDSTDKTFDQVRRPQGSTYLELYSTANPNIPQSTELYTFDPALKLWKLELSRMTPAKVNYRSPDDPIDTISPYAELEFPVWRVAISASCDPRGLGDDVTRSDGRKIHKKANSIFQHLLGEASYSQTFSMQTRQFNGFRDHVSSGGTDDGEDKREEVKKEWRDLDIPAGNILGPTAYANDTEAANDQIELDRIVWMTRPLAEGGKAWKITDNNREHIYPDASRLFWRIFESPVEVSADSDVNKTEQIRSYLFPNQYLVIGPEDERSIGSIRRNATSGLESLSPAPLTGYYGVPSLAKILLNYSPRNAETDKVQSITPVLNPNMGTTMRVGTYYGINSDSDTISYRRGLNISEPLWVHGDDPYADPAYKAIPTQTVTFNGMKYLATKEFVEGDASTVVPDHPFDMPKAWDDDKPLPTTSKISPVAEDHLCGNGTIPGYRSAFLQRVADPNRPYHPLMNPYLTVDWNMMDLTVFNGEETEIADNSDSKDNYIFSTEEEVTDELGLENKLFLKDPIPGFEAVPEPDRVVVFTPTYGSIFSSRQWGNAAQPMFNASKVSDNVSPNPWGRAIEALKSSDSDATTAGLETGIALDAIRKYNSVGNVMIPLSDAEKAAIAVAKMPNHTLGWYNDRGTALYDDDNRCTYTKIDQNLATPYYGIPCKPRTSNDNSTETLPFEHLIWNDAPLTSPAELALIPASAPGRFGLEFVRTGATGTNSAAGSGTGSESGSAAGSESSGGSGTESNNALKCLYEGIGRSLGSGTQTTNLFGYPFAASNSESGSGSSGGSGSGSASSNETVIGPYLNFFHSSDSSIAPDGNDDQAGLGRSLNLAKLFDFVTIPSPYVGTRQPVKAWNSETGQFAQLWDNEGPVYVSTLREPGKVNLNTASQPVWDALGTGLNWEPALQNQYPFQPAQTSSLAPPLLDNSGESETWDNPNRWGAASTLFTPSITKNEENGALGAGTPLFSPNNYNNMYTALQDIQRLSGLTTNRSNVFAVWLTVGYFEMETAQPGVNIPSTDPDGNNLNAQTMFSDPDYKYREYYKAIYPDGYTYGKELGSGGGLEGGISRTRAFYIIDRSVPFDFRRGRSLNWEKAVLLQRIL